MITFRAAPRTARAGGPLGARAGVEQARTATTSSATPHLTRPTVVTRRPARQNSSVRRIGHRGAMGHAPENTIASFQKALDLACDEVETDVWRSEEHTSEL